MGGARNFPPINCGPHSQHVRVAKCAGEKIPTKMSGKVKVPVTPSDVTPEWLREAVLASNGEELEDVEIAGLNHVNSNNILYLFKEIKLLERSIKSVQKTLFLGGILHRFLFNYNTPFYAVYL